MVSIETKDDKNILKQYHKSLPKSSRVAKIHNVIEKVCLDIFCSFLRHGTLYKTSHVFILSHIVKLFSLS